MRLRLVREAIVPPRTPEREKETLHDIIESGGITRFNKKATYHYNGNDIPITVMGIHYGFSVANALAYGLLAEKISTNHCLKRIIIWRCYSYCVS